MKFFSSLSLNCLVFCGLTSAAVAGERFLEVSGDGKRLNATVKFFHENNEIGEGEIEAERYEWLPIPDNVSEFEIRVGVISSGRKPIYPEGNTFVTVNSFSTEGIAGSLTVLLDIDIKKFLVVQEGETGYVYAGRLESPYGASSNWRSFYFVSADSREVPVGDFLGTTQTLLFPNSEWRLDFPIYLRSWNVETNRPIHSESDSVVRGGQRIKVLELTEPDHLGNVYAKVSIL